MFEKSDYVFYASEGICRVDDVVSSPFTDIDPDAKYYVLHSTHGGSGTIFIPVERADTLIRAVMTKREISALISSIEGITLFEECPLKQLKEKYQIAIRSGVPSEWVRVIRTVDERSVNGRDGGKKVSDAERAIADNARKFLYKEISVVLNIPEEEAERYIAESSGVTV